jgi:hypothetical protein
MLPEILFPIHLVLGYVAWLLCFRTYALPKLRSMGRFEAQRIIATIHSFRFFGLVFILPGVVGTNLPAGFATFAAYGDFATGVLAILALLAARIRPLFWSLVAAFNLVGVADLLIDYYHAIHVNLPAQAGQLGAAYVIPIIYVPLLMITHVVSLYWLLRPQEKTLQIPRGNAAQL